MNFRHFGNFQRLIEEFPKPRLINEFPTLFKLVQGLIWEFPTLRKSNEFPTLFNTEITKVPLLRLRFFC